MLASLPLAKQQKPSDDSKESLHQDHSSQLRLIPRNFFTTTPGYIYRKLQPRKYVLCLFDGVFARIQGGCLVDKGEEKAWKEMVQVSKVHKWQPPNRFHFDSWDNYGGEGAELTSTTLKLIPNVSCHAKLKQLLISLTYHSKITDEGLQSFVLQLIRKSPNLQDLRFYFSGCTSITPDSVKDAIYSIARHLISLRHLSLGFHNDPQLNDEGLEVLGYQVGRHLINLEYLEVFLAYNDFQMRGRNMNPAPFSDNGLKALGLHIGRNLVNLKELVLVISSVRAVGDKGIKSFIIGVHKRLGHLLSLRLSFKGCGSITGSGMKAFVSEICKNMKNLQYLDLNFNGCVNIFPNDVKGVKNKVKKELPQLKEFKFNDALVE